MKNTTKHFMLTTIDNPYNPFTEFTSWYLFDMTKGYDTCGYIDRIAKTSEQFSEQENELIISNAIDEIIKYDFRNIYKRVQESDYNKRS